MIRSVEINARFLTQPITGVQRFAVEMVRGLDRQLASSAQLRDRYRFRMIAPGTARNFELEHIPLLRTGRLSGHAWEQLELPRKVGRRLVLNLCNTAPVLSGSVVAIHDALVFAVPEAFSRPFRAWYRFLLPLLGKTAVRVLTVSQFSRGELERLARIPGNKLAIVPAGCEHIQRVEADRRIFERVPVKPGEYLLAVGSQARHKNMRLVAEALTSLGNSAPPLVIAGGANPRIFGETGAARHNGVHPAGYVTEGELRALYEAACGFVYPSLYEGFGIPPLEAMACGCATIVARAAALPEVCGEAALYCDPRDPEDLARQIRGLTGDLRLRDTLRKRGLERSRSFTWERASAALLDLLDQVPGA